MAVCCDRSYQLLYRTPSGMLIDLIRDAFKIDWVLKLNAPGLLTLELPCVGCSPVGRGYSMLDFGPDYRFELWRECCGVKQLVGDSPFFLTKISRRVEEDGTCTIAIEAETALGLVDRRINSYDADRPESDLVERSSDDQMKYIIRNNLLAGATSYLNNYGADPIRASLAPYLSVAVDTSLSSVLHEEDIENDRLLNILGNIADAAFAAGQPIFFDVVQTSQYTNPFLQFRTWINQRGVDRTVATGGANAVVLREGAGICAHEATFDWTETINRIYAGGEGDGDDRLYSEAQADGLAATLAANPFALREDFFSGNSENAGDLANEAAGELGGRLAGYSVEGLLCETDAIQYCSSFGFGDRISVYIDGVMTDVFVEAESGGLADGAETLDVRFTTNLNSRLRGIGGVLQDMARYRRQMEHLRTIERA